MELIHSIFGDDPVAGLLIILNLVVIESLLSVDNAAVLATMVMDLPEDQRKKALKYGIVGAYVFRGIALLLASWLTKIWWLKPVGGIYLLYLAINYFMTKKTKETSDDTLNKKEKWLYKNTIGMFGPFWSTVILVELMDMAFSIDNVFAAVAFTDHLGLIMIGVFIGILAMRFVAQGFVKMMEKFPFLEKAAFFVILILGVKLTISAWTHFNKYSPVAEFLESERADLYVSLTTVAVFVFPIMTSYFMGWPEKKQNNNSDIK